MALSVHVKLSDVAQLLGSCGRNVALQILALFLNCLTFIGVIIPQKSFVLVYLMNFLFFSIMLTKSNFNLLCTLVLETNDATLNN